ncbi:MAG: NADPH-dependent FMN reductase [Actinomycetaceae bacterium]|nr:NADPH-dependent FMN reductase [Actinomycetaceae bacterium]
MHKQISILVGSLRTKSYARQIAMLTQSMFPSDYDVRILEIGDLPLYNFDYDDPQLPEVAVPEVYTEFRTAIKNSSAVLFVTSENNRLLPACLKNAVDIGSKPNDDVAWKGKVAGIISHSVGRMGGYSAQKSLRLALSYFDMVFPNQPEVFLGQSSSLLDEAGSFNSPATHKFVQAYIARIVDLIESVSASENLG